MATDVTKLVEGLNAHQVHTFKRLAVPVLMALRESIRKNRRTVFVDFDQAQKPKEKEGEKCQPSNKTKHCSDL